MTLSLSSRSLRTIPISLAACLSLTACMPQAVKYDDNSPYSKVTAGSSISLRQKIEVPPGVTRVFMQDGRITAAYNRYAANCNIEVRKLDNQAVQYVEPGDYIVSKVQNTLEEVVSLQPLQVAALNMKLAGMDDGGAMMVYQGYHLWLQSEDPNVMRLSCRGAFAEQVDARPPSINEIRQSLGDIMSLSMNE